MQHWIDSLWQMAMLALPAMAFLLRRHRFPRLPLSALFAASLAGVYGLALLRTRMSASAACDVAELATTCGSPPWFAQAVETVSCVALAFLIVEGVSLLTRRLRRRP